MQAPSRLKDGKRGGAEAAADSRELRVNEPACGPSEQGGGRAARVSLNPLKAIERVWGGGGGGKKPSRNSLRQSSPRGRGRCLGLGFSLPFCLHAHILVHWARSFHKPNAAAR